MAFLDKIPPANFITAAINYNTYIKEILNLRNKNTAVPNQIVGVRRFRRLKRAHPSQPRKLYAILTTSAVYLIIVIFIKAGSPEGVELGGVDALNK